MTEGQTKSVTLSPDTAYGPINPNAFIEVPKQKFPEDFQFKEDGYVRSQGPGGRPVFGKITEVKDETVVLDVNHPMAGRELVFDIRLVEIEDEEEASDEVAAAEHSESKDTEDAEE